MLVAIAAFLVYSFARPSPELSSSSTVRESRIGGPQTIAVTNNQAIALAVLPFANLSVRRQENRRAWASFKSDMRVSPCEKLLTGVVGCVIVRSRCKMRRGKSLSDRSQCAFSEPKLNGVQLEHLSRLPNCSVDSIAPSCSWQNAARTADH